MLVAQFEAASGQQEYLTLLDRSAEENENSNISLNANGSAWRVFELSHLRLDYLMFQQFSKQFSESVSHLHPIISSCCCSPASTLCGIERIDTNPIDFCTRELQ